MRNLPKLQFILSFLLIGMMQVSCISSGEREIIVQAHRGGAALYPENTIPAMINAVGAGIKTLELDLHITGDSQVVVSHDPFLNSSKVLFPNGKQILKEQEDSLLIFHIDYDSLSKFDVGSLANPQYPRRKNLNCVIPSLSNLIDCVEAYAYSCGSGRICYNIEIKSLPEKDEKSSPDYKTFCDLSMKVLQQKNLKDRLCIQSFDSRALNYIHREYPDVILSYLVEDKGLGIADMLKALDFVPQIISPVHSIVNRNLVAEAHELHMKVIPWTVDNKEEVLRLKGLGVDEIITNVPDSVQFWLNDASKNTIYKRTVRWFENVLGY